MKRNIRICFRVDNNSTILFVSHNRDEVYRLCDKMAVIHNGKVEVTGEKKEIFKNPKTVSAAILTGCKNITEIVTEGQYIYCKDWNIRKRIVCSEKVIGKSLGIRAHDIKVIKEREYADAKCVVEHVIESTFDMIYLLKKCIFPFGKRHFYFCGSNSGILEKELVEKCTIPYNK